MNSKLPVWVEGVVWCTCSRIKVNAVSERYYICSRVIHITHKLLHLQKKKNYHINRKGLKFEAGVIPLFPYFYFPFSLLYLSRSVSQPGPCNMPTCEHTCD